MATACHTITRPRRVAHIVRTALRATRCPFVRITALHHRLPRRTTTALSILRTSLASITGTLRSLLFETRAHLSAINGNGSAVNHSASPSRQDARQRVAGAYLAGWLSRFCRPARPLSGPLSPILKNQQPPLFCHHLQSSVDPDWPHVVSQSFAISPPKGCPAPPPTAKSSTPRAPLFFKSQKK